MLQPAARARCEAFEAAVPTSRAVRLPGPYFIFLTHPDRVAAEIERFVARDEREP